MSSPLCGCADKFGLTETTETCYHAAVICKGGDLVVPRSCFKMGADARFDWTGTTTQAFVSGGPTPMTFSGYVDTPSTFKNDTCYPMQTVFTIGQDWLAGVSVDQDLGVLQQILVDGGVWAQNGASVQKGPGGFMVGKNQGFTVAGPVLAAGASIKVQARSQYILGGTPNALTGWSNFTTAVRIWGANTCS